MSWMIGMMGMEKMKSNSENLAVMAIIRAFPDQIIGSEKPGRLQYF